jgi:hypothetical protein
MTRAVLITKGTDAEQAQGLAEGLGYAIHAEFGGFFLTAEDLATILNANVEPTTDPLGNITITLEMDDGGSPIQIDLHATDMMARRFQAYAEGQQCKAQLLRWVCDQDRLTIERWCHPGGKSSVSVWTSIDDEDTPSGKGTDTYQALEMAQAHQLNLISEG